MAEVIVAAEQMRATMISTTLRPEAPVQFRRNTPNVKIIAIDSQIIIVEIVRAELVCPYFLYQGL